MTVGIRIGHLQFYRSKGIHWIETFRPWLLPIFGGAGLAKFLGLDTGLSLLLAVAIPALIEGGAIWLGRMEHRTGAIEAHYQLAAELDPFRAESLRRLRAQELLLGNILEVLLEMQTTREPEPHEWPAQSARAERKMTSP